MALPLGANPPYPIIGMSYWLREAVLLPSRRVPIVENTVFAVSPEPVRKIEHNQGHLSHAGFLSLPLNSYVKEGKAVSCI